MRNYSLFNGLFNADHSRMCDVPLVNIAETENGFTIEMAAPGYSKSDFDVSIDKNVLTVSVDKESGKAATTTEAEPVSAEAAASAPASAAASAPAKRTYRREFRFGSFSRSFTLPDGIDSEKIDGEYLNGILTINIPKAEAKITKTSVSIR
ncbi:MAG: Hsp20/alpha crystallin family protein [Bacteroidales bacterium]|nr:Hsp20/alpha crystallin family protein [Bacteroidales bacterium]